MDELAHSEKSNRDADGAGDQIEATNSDQGSVVASKRSMKNIDSPTSKYHAASIVKESSTLKDFGSAEKACPEDAAPSESKISYENDQNSKSIGIDQKGSLVQDKSEVEKVDESVQPELHR